MKPYKTRLSSILTKLILACLVSVLATSALAIAKQKQQPPNVVFIVTDDEFRRDFGYLESQSLTPNIDRLAHEGLEFTQNHVVSSVCTPSRYTCLTGQYASRATNASFRNAISEEGMTRVQWNTLIEKNQQTLPKVLQKNGYRTGFVGKWHVGLSVDGYVTLPKGSDARDPKINQALKDNHEKKRQALMRHYGFDYADAVYSGNPNDDPSLVATGLNVHNMEWLTQAALRFIEENQDEPFYLYFSPTLLHVPHVWDSLKVDPRMSGAGYLDEPVTGVQPSRASVIERVEKAGLPFERAGATWLDDGIGAVLDKLQELGLHENTLVIFFNDQGMEDGGKGTCYQGGLITPTIAYWPERIQSGKSDALLQNVDFVPTILDLCDVQAPKDMIIDGKSFLPILDGESITLRESVYGEIGIIRSVATRDWKYVALRVPESLREKHPGEAWYHMALQPGGSQWEKNQLNYGGPWQPHYFDEDQLFNIAEDPREMVNLAKDPTYAEKLVEMKALLASHLKNIPGTYAEFKPQP